MSLAWNASDQCCRRCSWRLFGLSLGCTSLRQFLDNVHMTFQEQPRNPLHGLTLERIVSDLVDYYGWSELGLRVQVRCFNQDPSISSSLKFLRKTPWAREQVEQLYVTTQHEYEQAQQRRNQLSERFED